LQIQGTSIYLNKKKKTTNGSILYFVIRGTKKLQALKSNIKKLKMRENIPVKRNERKCQKAKV
jgi:hypothetical protein